MKLFSFLRDANTSDIELPHKKEKNKGYLDILVYQSVGVFPLSTWIAADTSN